MLTEGTIRLPNGQAIHANWHGSYTCGTDLYPMVILGWSKSGKTIFCQEAKFRRCDSSGYGEDQAWMIWVNPNGRKFKATWRSKEKQFRKSYHEYGFVYTDGFSCHRDPSF